MANDSTRRSGCGVVITLAKLDDTHTRILVDEVQADTQEWPQVWTSRVLLTHRDFPSQEIVDNELAETHLAELAELIIAYLAAKQGPAS